MTVEVPNTDQLRVVGVGCGEPKKSMGWFHLQQMLGDPRLKFDAVVEPWFLGAGKEAPGSEAFAKFCEEMRAKHPDVLLCSSTEELPMLRGPDDPPVLAVIAGRTCDAPKLFRGMCERGVSHIYLEKPGAESAADLEDLALLAREQGVAVVVGYNKNVSDYVQGALAQLEGMEDMSPTVVLEHNNAFDTDEDLLSFVRGPGAEGLVHNMCCHELALAATLFGVTRQRVHAVVLEPDESELFELVAPKEDWRRVAYRLLLRDVEGSQQLPLAHRLPELRFVANRSGGNFSQVRVTAQGQEERCFRLPSPEQEIEVRAAQAEGPEVRPYFFQQATDYQRLRGGFAQHILEGLPGTPPGVVDLRGAVETLRLADMIAHALRECHQAGEPW
eukprot:CAMPEP_0194545958 /NCGR_PEP_ID=MMETSP0253-20130528/89953_1 /TAXON_ID=2966 /ORGANISM="Noctiluca scintillans" /LENGTH=386 /DNA_ID=CAMNT_0039393005 /DNA_START=42 /DNA_END=1199 /DNA_ORIENTATION=+